MRNWLVHAIVKKNISPFPGNSLKLPIHERGMYEYREVDPTKLFEGFA